MDKMKAITFFDLDGTLLDGTSQITPEMNLQQRNVFHCMNMSNSVVMNWLFTMSAVFFVQGILAQ